MNKTRIRFLVGWSGIFMILLLVSLLTAFLSLCTVAMVQNQYVKDSWREYVIMNGYDRDIGQSNITVEEGR